MIRKIFDPGNYSNKISITLLVLRITVGIMMLTHGIGKFTMLFGDEPIKFADPIGVGVTTSLALTVFAEVVCSLLLIAGLVTRLVVLPLLFTMLVAIFIVHKNDGFGKQELPLLYAAIYAVIAIAGAGKYSLDNLVYQKLHTGNNN
ncbi:MAG: DoxX family protein [Bacteroidota bacterium]|nr:DoxX family protein [Bacteroidota bacterium]